jgi:hypothetical protein
MENPACWKPAELVVLDALEDHFDMLRAGACGLSQNAMICDRLRQAGYLKDADEPEIGWDKLREHRAARSQERSIRSQERCEPGPTTPAPGDRRSQT